MAETASYSIFGVGNALLDVSADVLPEVFEQFGLAKGGACLAESKHDPLFKQLHADPKVQYIPGGATLNSIRVANWMLKSQGVENKCAYTSCLGKDSSADTFKNGCATEGLVTAFAEDPKEPTGECAVCIYEKERSLVAKLGAANAFPTGENDYMLTADAGNLWKNSDICYVAGFWLTVNAERMTEMAKWYKSQGKTFCLNISAEFLAQFFFNQMSAVLENTKILFGNETEAKALAKACNLQEKGINLENPDLAKCAELFLSLSTDPEFRVVITQGADDCIIASKDGVKKYKTPAMDSNLIVDTNGAGDAFVGGFLSALSLGKSEETCVAWGNYAAQFIIQTSGCQFGGKTASP